MRHIYILFLFLIAMDTAIAEWIDLESNPQSFILETKRIIIPEYPDAFNPTIVDYHGQRLLMFRIRDPLTLQTNQVGWVWLDENLNPISSPKKIKFTLPEGAKPNLQDPRVVQHGNSYYIAFNNFVDLPYSSKSNRRMFIAELLYDGADFTTTLPQVFIEFEGEDPTRQEKNWSPFVFGSEILLEYMISPHTVFLPETNSERCLTFSSSDPKISWEWGELRGGAPPRLMDGFYFGFFHSSINMTSLQSDGIYMQHYFMGAYIFEGEPPFQLTKISDSPIVGKNFYEGPAYKTWKPLRVVFPGGFIFDDQYIWLAYGRQDHEMWVVKFDKEALIKSLKPVGMPEHATP